MRIFATITDRVADCWVLLALIPMLSVCSGSTGTTTEPTPPPTRVATSVSVSPSSADLEVDASLALTATVLDAQGAPMSGQSVSWSSSNQAAATVSATGLVTGVSEGAVIITATSANKSG